MNWTITKGIKGDEKIIAQFQVDMAMESEDLALDLETVIRGVTAGIEDPSKGTYFVARNEQGSPIGSLFLTKEWSDWTCRWYWWIQSVYVVPEYRRKGVFTSLFNAVDSAAKEEGVRSIRLYVDRTNSSAQECYHKQGMHESHYLMYENSSEE